MDRSDNEVFRARSSLAITQEEMGKRLGYSRNYVHLLESGAKPVTPQVRKRLADVSNSRLSMREGSTSVTNTPASGICRYPAGCDMDGRLKTVESTLLELKVQIGVLTQLLGATLASSSPAVADVAKKKAG